MPTISIEEIEKTLVHGGLEIYQKLGHEIQVAERIRVHMMDSGVRILPTDAGVLVRFSGRSQKSDFPNLDSDLLFSKVRQAIGEQSLSRGYIEAAAVSQTLCDPIDASKILDVWHEVTYEKQLDNLVSLVEEIRWALALEKYIAL